MIINLVFNPVQRGYNEGVVVTVLFTEVLQHRYDDCEPARNDSDDDCFSHRNHAKN